MDFRNNNEGQPGRNISCSDMANTTWGSVDLKVLLAVLSLADPPISQAKVASLLKVSPVTLSRLVNSNDHNVRDSWIPVLSDCLVNVDMNTIKSTVDSLNRIHNSLKEKKQLMDLKSVVEGYLLKLGDNYKFDAEYWGQAYNILRFYSEEQNHQWLFSLGRSFDNDGWRSSRHPYGPFTRFNRLRSISDSDKISILYSDSVLFAETIKTAKSYFDSSTPMHQIAKYYSFILCSLEEGKVIEEFIVSNPVEDFWD